MLFVRQTCNLSYTVGILMNVIAHAQFGVVLICCVLEWKLEANVVRFRPSGLGSMWFGGVDQRIPHIVSYKYCIGTLVQLIYQL